MKTIKALEILGKTSIYLRDEIMKLQEQLVSEKDSFVLDLEGIDFMSPSATHELIVFVKENQLKLSNMSSFIRSLLESQVKARNMDVIIENHIFLDKESAQA